MASSHVVNHKPDIRKGYVTSATHGRVALILRMNGSDIALQMEMGPHEDRGKL